MAKAPIYRDKGNKDMEREGAGGKSDKPESKAKPAEGEKKESKAEEKKEEAAEEKGDPKMEERLAMHKRHQSETTDHHNNAREALKQMHKRHEKDVADLNERHMADQADQGSGQEEGQQPMAEEAQGGGAQSAAAA